MNGKGILTLLCAMVLGNCRPAVAEKELVIELSGMLAFIDKGDGTLELALPNMVDSEAAKQHKVVHWPMVELSCDDITEEKQRKACGDWTPVVSHGYGSIPLQYGYDIEFIVEKDSEDEKPTLDATFEKGVRRLDRLVLTNTPAGKAKRILVSPAAEDPERLRDLVAARWLIDAGRIDAAIREDVTWNFGQLGGTPIGKDLKNAKSFRVRRALPAGKARLLLKPYDGGKVLEIPLAPYGGNSELLVRISNEPHPIDYCRHPPSSMHPQAMHFMAFYELSQVLRSEIPSLPLPIAVNPAEICKEYKTEGKRVNCDAAVLSWP